MYPSRNNQPVNDHPDTLQACYETIDALRKERDRINQLITDMQSDQRASDKGAMMFIAALVHRFGDTTLTDDACTQEIFLSEYDLLMGSEVTLHKADDPAALAGVRLATTIETTHEAELRKAWNMTREGLPAAQRFVATLELPPDHIITGEAAAARGTRMLQATAANPGETKE
jgi:hypothetical protein